MGLIIFGDVVFSITFVVFYGGLLTLVLSVVSLIWLVLMVLMFAC